MAAYPWPEGLGILGITLDTGEILIMQQGDACTAGACLTLVSSFEKVRPSGEG